MKCSKMNISFLRPELKSFHHSNKDLSRFKEEEISMSTFYPFKGIITKGEMHSLEIKY